MVQRAYYDIFPFPQEREDARAALIAQTISNMSGRMLKDFKSIKDFLPDYLEKQDKQEEKTEEQKIAEHRAYVEFMVSNGFMKMEKKAAKG